MKMGKTEDKEEYHFLNRGYTSFPLRDIGKKFEVLDTIDILIKKTKRMDIEKTDKLMLLHMAYREIEEAVWKEVTKNKLITEKADWLVISTIHDYGDKIRVSLDMLKEG